ncbi:hypothetical protein [Amycolatopsis vastitatis]|uniref:DNA-binding phage zinc finger domain-containing protein n=1 Tax=Amycolatopsis vastitatis TaxID=1905142 RepID=A0A229SWU1_9PSEU|nr:hypothetical protein [Amycolatopsis vastitatis]OXM63124.1 hypothetical protein CF165_32725 [Amycolatopsis vastitatis]
MTVSELSRGEVIDLLTRHRGARIPSDASVGAWQHALTGYTAAECHAALLRLGPNARHATPAEITNSVDAARDRAVDTDSETATAAEDETDGESEDEAATGDQQRRREAREPGKGQPPLYAPVRLDQTARAAQRECYRQAGLRGRRAVYAAMGWDRDPDADPAASRSVPCPFCKAKTWVACSPLTRNTGGVRDTRDPATGSHAARLARVKAKAALAQRRHDNDTPEGTR